MTVLFARIVGFAKLIMPRKLTICSVTNVTEIETLQYAANAYLANTSITWKKVPNAIIVGTGFVCRVPNTRMTATITVLTVKETKVKRPKGVA